MRRWLIGLMVGLLVGITGLFLGLSPLGASLELAVGLTWLFNVRGSIEPPEDVVVVAMDSRTGEQLPVSWAVGTAVMDTAPLEPSGVRVRASVSAKLRR